MKLTLHLVKQLQNGKHNILMAIYQIYSLFNIKIHMCWWVGTVSWIGREWGLCQD